MKLLLVEDEARMSRLLVRGLTEEGHQVDACALGADALEQAFALPYDVAILDWMLPDMDGLSVLRAWRRRGIRTPVLMLTARGTTAEKVTGLRTGADDYLVKPFDFEELLARLLALHRRGSGAALENRIGPLLLDGRRRVLARGEEEVSLTAREFALLSELAAHPGEALSRFRLLESVWGSGFEGSPNVVDVYVGYLRAKLERLGEHGIVIEAVRGVGYRLPPAPETT